MQSSINIHGRAYRYFAFSSVSTQLTDSPIINISSSAINFHSCKLSTTLQSQFFSSKPSPPSKWFTPLWPAARPPALESVSAPPRPSAPVARRAPSTALATRLLLRTPSPDLAAHAVCSTPLTKVEYQITNFPMQAPALLVSAPVSAPQPRTRPLMARPAPVAAVLLVSLATWYFAIPQWTGLTLLYSVLHLWEGWGCRVRSRGRLHHPRLNRLICLWFSIDFIFPIISMNCIAMGVWVGWLAFRWSKSGCLVHNYQIHLCCGRIFIVTSNEKNIKSSTCFLS